MVEMYREPVDPAQAGAGVTDEADRAAVIARFEAYLKVLDAARSRGWPIAVAMLVIGTGVLVSAVRTLGGNRGSRPILLQLVVVRAALGAASYWLMVDVDAAELRLREARQAAEVHQSFPQEQQQEYAAELLRKSGWLLRIQPRLQLAIGTLASGLIVIALTRRRARDFFDESARALGGR